MRRLIWVTAAAAVALAAAAPAARADVTPEYFTLPPGITGVGTGLDVASDGTLFFGGSGADQGNPPLGRFDTSQAAAGTSNGITGIPTGPKTIGSGFTAIRDVSWSAKDNAVYFTRSDGRVGSFNGTAIQSTVLDGYIAAAGIAAAPGGGAWFSESGDGPQVPPGQDRLGNRIAYLSPQLGVTPAVSFAQQTPVFDDSRFNANPQGIAVAPDGTPWVAEYNAGLPGYRIATYSGKYTEYFPPCVPGSYCSGQFNGSALSDVAVAPDGSIWYTNELKHSIGRLVPGGQVTEYKLADMDPTLAPGAPRAIRAAVDGTLWVAVNGGFSAPGANAILRIVPTAEPSKTIYKLGVALQPFEVAPDTKGNVWISGSPQGTGAGPIGRLAGVVAGITAPPTGEAPIGPPVVPPVTTTLTPSTTVKAQINNPTVHGSSITANQICVGPPQDRCSLVYLIQTHEYVTGFPGTKGSAAKVKTFTIGKKTVTLKGGQKAKVTVKLNTLGKKLFKKKKKFKATLTVTQAVKGVKKPKTILKKNVTFKR